MSRYLLRDLGMSQVMLCRGEIRSLLTDRPAASQEEGARRIADYLYESFVDDDGQPACALVRLFKTQLYEGLDDELKEVSRAIEPDADNIRELRCLTLLASRGSHRDWNSRLTSAGHRAIPLASEAFIEQAPMIAQLFRQLGAKLSQVVRPDRSLLLDASETTFNVFHIAEAAGSPFIPAQDFVERNGVRSVIGFGGMQLTGDMYVAILFSRVPISAEVADLFKVLGLNMRIALIPVARKPLFDR